MLKQQHLIYYLYKYKKCAMQILICKLIHVIMSGPEDNCAFAMHAGNLLPWQPTLLQSGHRNSVVSTRSFKGKEKHMTGTLC